MADDPYIEAFNKFQNAILEAKDSGNLSQDEMVEMVDSAFYDDEVAEAQGHEKPRRKKKK